MAEQDLPQNLPQNLQNPVPTRRLPGRDAVEKAARAADETLRHGADAAGDVVSDAGAHASGARDAVGSAAAGPVASPTGATQGNWVSADRLADAGGAVAEGAGAVSAGVDGAGDADDAAAGLSRVDGVEPAVRGVDGGIGRDTVAPGGALRAEPAAAVEPVARLGAVDAAAGGVTAGSLPDGAGAPGAGAAGVSGGGGVTVHRRPALEKRPFPWWLAGPAVVGLAGLTAWQAIAVRHATEDDLTKKAEEALRARFPEARIRFHGRDAVIDGITAEEQAEAHDLVRNLEGVRHVSERTVAPTSTVTPSSLPPTDAVAAADTGAAGAASAATGSSADGASAGSSAGSLATASTVGSGTGATASTTVARAGAAAPTAAPTTAAPTTVAPTTVAPTTAAPTTVAPTTAAPTTAAPTTAAPTTATPTSVAPTTVAPTTAAPTTATPTTAAPTTPTTAAPATPSPAAPTSAPAVETAPPASAVGVASPVTVRFDTDACDVSSQADPSLDEVVAYLTANPDVTVSLRGYSDSRGTRVARLAVSACRADAVRAALVARGIDASRIHARGFGAAHRVATNSTATGRAANRRVEITFVGGRTISYTG